MCFFIHLPHRTLFLRNITCCVRWRTDWASSTSLIWKKWKNGSTHGCFEGRKFLSSRNPSFAWEKVVAWNCVLTQLIYFSVCCNFPCCCSMFQCLFPRLSLMTLRFFRGRYLLLRIGKSLRISSWNLEVAPILGGPKKWNMKMKNVKRRYQVKSWRLGRAPEDLATGAPVVDLPSPSYLRQISLQAARCAHRSSPFFPISCNQLRDFLRPSLNPTPRD